jgi:hypothetical protein
VVNEKQSTSGSGSDSDLLLPNEAARFLRLKNAQTLAVWRCTKRYPLPLVRIGSRICYRRGDLEEFVRSRTVDVEAAAK